jgi:hypothetical protein
MDRVGPLNPAEKRELAIQKSARALDDLRNVRWYRLNEST